MKAREYIQAPMVQIQTIDGNCWSKLTLTEARQFKRELEIAIALAEHAADRLGIVD